MVVSCTVVKLCVVFLCGHEALHSIWCLCCVSVNTLAMCVVSHIELANNVGASDGHCMADCYSLLPLILKSAQASQPGAAIALPLWLLHRWERTY
jgi:hypothetical protein